MHLGIERGSIVVAQNVARATTPAVELHDREPRRLRAPRWQNLPLVPLETPKRRANPIAPRIRGRELAKHRLERLILMAEHAHAAPVVERTGVLVSTDANVILLAGRRVVRIGLLVLQQHGLAIVEPG